jgi:RNA exonuclease 1
MTKRKRGDSGEETVDVGLGATLAHLRGEDQTHSTTTNATNDNEGWTVVGSKRRRKERDLNHDTGRKGSYSYQFDHNPRNGSNEAHGSHNNHRDESDEQRRSPSCPTEDHNAFASNNASDERLPPSENPFSKRRSDGDDASLSREERRKERKLDRHYPAIEHSHHARLQSHVKITDLQALVLYLLADGNAPQWVSVRSRTSIQKVVMLMVPGLDLGMFNGNIALGAESLPETASNGGTMEILPDVVAPAEDGAEPKRLRISPDDFYPATLRSSRLPDAIRPLADMFDHVWPIKAPGEHRANQYIRLHSPIHTMLTAQIPKTQEEKQMKKKGNHKGPMPQNSKHWDNKRTRITEYIIGLIDQQENEYVPHPAMFTTPESKEAALQSRRAAKQSIDDGWVDTNVANVEDGQVPEKEIEQGSVTAGRRIISVDCEMCKAENDEFVLTRVSLLDWDGGLLMDKLVKPDLAIKDYLTQYSGITAAMLENVTTTLSDIQKELLELITPRTILGFSTHIPVDHHTSNR